MNSVKDSCLKEGKVKGPIWPHRRQNRHLEGGGGEDSAVLLKLLCACNGTLISSLKENNDNFNKDYICFTGN